MSRLLTRSTVIAVAALVAASMCSAALAAPLQARPRVHVGRGTSSNWSGYAAETNLTTPANNAVSDVVGSWQVPFVTGSVNAWSSAWVGIDGYSSGSVEQIGTDSDTTRKGQSYYAWWEMYPNPSFIISGFAVNPGNLITARVHYIGSNQYVLSINNSSTGGSFQTTQTLAAARSSAEWVMEAPSSGNNILPLANFGTINFSGCSATLNGVSGPISQWAYDPMTMVGQNRKGTYTKAQVNPLTSSGSAFSVTWKHS